MTSFTENEDEVEKRSVKNTKRLKKEQKRLKKFGGKWSGNFTMTAQQFDQLYTFSKNIGWRFIFDLNELKRKDNGTTWDSTNAKELLDYTSSKGYDFDFELGNEQDIIQPRLTSQQNVQDYKDLRALLDSYPIYKNSLVMGPSTAGASSMFSE
uniref:Uncharacterized protein n=1 Tax=Acrobeloides nanus TaxID=290746 RepID=A0A914D766_9BILA